MRERVTLHPETVQKAAELATERKRRRKKQKVDSPSSSRVQRKKVDPRVWKRAVKIANGNTKRLVVESETSVLIRN